MPGYGQSRETVILRVVGVRCTELNTWIVSTSRDGENGCARTVITGVMD